VLFFEIRTPDGWGIPGVHGPWAPDELDGNVQGAVYWIESDGEALLFDSGNRVPGTDIGMGPAIVEKIERSGARVKYLFISHFHYDHTGNAAMIAEQYGPEVLAHRLDRPIIEDPLIVTRPDNLERFGVTGDELLEDFNLAPGESLGLSDPAVIERYWNFPVAVDREVDDGDVLEVGRLRLEVVHLPGHSPGQIGIWNPDTRSLYCADIIHFPSPLVPYPIGNASDHIATLEKCKALEPHYLWEGHYLSVYDPAAVQRRLDHLLRMQHDTAARLLTLLRRNSEPQTILELMPEVFPIKLELNYPVSSGIGERWAYAEATIQCHLRRLMDLGEVVRLRDGQTIRFAAADASPRFSQEER
jgi:glyoxylase-like metal-dependent hydrolase (beta-lactamase superfamily II)